MDGWMHAISHTQIYATVHTRIIARTLARSHACLLACLSSFIYPATSAQAHAHHLLRLTGARVCASDSARHTQTRCARAGRHARGGRRSWLGASACSSTVCKCAFVQAIRHMNEFVHACMHEGMDEW